LTQRKRIAASLAAILVVFFPLPVIGEIKTIITEATYIMGDGETPTFAESMALQKAKQQAIEQAGTYVEASTEVKNLKLTADEIRTIASGLVETETLDKKRLLEGEGMRVYIKIRAKVTTDNINQLATRIKGGSVVADYKKLQNSYAQLMIELESLKRQISETKSESARIDVLNQIREVEKNFHVVESNERAFHKRFISGQALSGMVEASLRNQEILQQETERKLQIKRAALERALNCLRENGHEIDVGPPEPVVTLKSQSVLLVFIVKAKVSPEAKEALRDLAKAFESDPDSFIKEAEEKINAVLNTLTLSLTVTLTDGKKYVVQKNHFHNFNDPRSWELRQLANAEPRVQEMRVDIPRSLVGTVSSVEATIAPR